MVYEGRNYLEVLDRVEALHLIQRAAVGRVGLVVDGEPVILPVNFVVDGDSIVFRTASGSKLDAAIAGATVSFEVDETDARRRAGWSVLVRGRARVLTDPEELAAAARLPLRPWSRGPKPHFVRIDTDTASGRRIPP